MGRPASFVLANSRSATRPGWVREEDSYTAASAPSFSRGLGKGGERPSEDVKGTEDTGRTPDEEVLIPPDVDTCYWPTVSEQPQPELRQSILEEEARDTLREVAVALRIKKPERLSTKDLITLLIAALPSRFFMHRWTDDSQLLVQILPSGVNSLHLAGRIGEDLPRLEKGMLGLGEAAVKGQFQTLKEVRWDIKAKLDAEDAVRSLLADAGVDFAYDSSPETRLSFYQGDSIPPANFENPYYSLPDSDDFEEL
ncbi:hypothetical protein BDW59DRAFT_163078 [Aspergillus cavernicola]|uniref:Uncharacterized protein n=1 Tax=Aspergillus cavernicola TaxID=176166 RepID=A0ABR4I7J3_9EURO